MAVYEVQNRIVIMLVALARMCFCMKSMGKVWEKVWEKYGKMLDTLGHV